MDMVEKFRPRERKSGLRVRDTKSLGRLLCGYAKRKSPQRRVLCTKRIYLRMPLRVPPTSALTTKTKRQVVPFETKVNKPGPRPPPPLPAPRRLTPIDYSNQHPAPILYASKPSFRQLSSTGDRLAMVLIAFEMERDLRERAEMNLVADQNKRHARSAARIADLASKLQDERVKREAVEMKLTREYEHKKKSFSSDEEEDLSDEEDDNTSMRRSLFRESLRSRGRSLTEEYGNIARRADKLEESISKTFSMARNLTQQNEIDLKDHKTFLKQIRGDTSFPLDENEDEVDEEDDPTRTLAIRELHALRAMIDEVDSLTDLYENFDRTVASSSLNAAPLKSFSPRKSKLMDL
eukprot:g7262.t1